MVEGLVRLMEARNAGGRPVNLGNPEEFTIAELAGLVMELSGRRVGLDERPLPEDDPRRRRPNIDRAKAVLGWAPTTPLRAGLPPTISHFERRLARPVIAHATITATAAE